MIIKSEHDLGKSELPDFNKDEYIIQFKIVYWGPGESGKTTNFLRLKEKFSLLKISNGYSIDTTDGRTLWHDSIFFTFNLQIKGKKYNIITQITTCTGQERFLSTREYVIDGADGVIFVGDSCPDKIEQNKRSYRELISFVNRNNIPIVIQLNKRDLPDAISLKNFKKHLGLPNLDKNEDGTPIVYETVALEGENVVRIFKDLVMKIFINFFIKNN
ncbi:MAG: GTPase domain-containing protein [Candidatus Lokiarchaeota archaeon]|nr:GTPase domain-containing protein [Candidatus Lokiarchaeota archaeon]